MKTLAVTGFVLAIVTALSQSATADAQPQPQAPRTWQGCCGAKPWPYGGGMRGGYGGMMGGSMARNHAAMTGGVPAAYAKARNPLPQTAATVERGATVYASNCASCHGSTGYGDGPAASGLNPRPANLAWLSRMPMSRWDPFMFWTVSEGGTPFGSAMPSFKDSLSEADRWAVIAYIQAHLSQVKAGR